MDKTEILSAIADIHNRLVEVNVKGDDAIRMADILRKCRSLAYQLQQDLKETTPNEVMNE